MRKDKISSAHAVAVLVGTRWPGLESGPHTALSAAAPSSVIQRLVVPQSRFFGWSRRLCRSIQNRVWSAMSFLITVLSQSKTAYGCAGRMGSVTDAAPVDGALDLCGVVAVPIVGTLQLWAAPLGSGRSGRCLRLRARLAGHGREKAGDERNGDGGAAEHAAAQK